MTQEADQQDDKNEQQAEGQEARPLSFDEQRELERSILGTPSEDGEASPEETPEGKSDEKSGEKEDEDREPEDVVPKAAVKAERFARKRERERRIALEKELESLKGRLESMEELKNKNAVDQGSEGDAIEDEIDPKMAQLAKELTTVKGELEAMRAVQEQESVKEAEKWVSNLENSLKEKYGLNDLWETKDGEDPAIDDFWQEVHDLRLAEHPKADELIEAFFVKRFNDRLIANEREALEKEIEKRRSSAKKAQAAPTPDSPGIAAGQIVGGDRVARVLEKLRAQGAA